jgi:Recombination endonuclease VII
LKRCPRCGLAKATAEFYSNVSSKDGLSSWCRECTRADARPRTSAYYKANREKVLARQRAPSRERMRARRAADPERYREEVRAWRAANPEKQKASERTSRLRNPNANARRNHGDWQPWWDKQGGLCAFCNKPLPPERSKIAMDHDHACCPGQMSCAYCRRGLAHGKCNKAIGMLGDDPELITAVAVNFARLHAETRQRIAQKGQDALPFDNKEAS